MKTITKLLAVALVGVLAFTGFAAATGGIGFDSAAANSTGFGAGDGTGPIHADDAERPLDGSNSPWVTGDERLDRFQERFDLTDDQMAAIQETVDGLIDDGGTPEEIHAAITEKLTEFGVEDPVLGPTGDRQHLGPFGNGHGAGNGPGNDQGQLYGQGQMHGQGLGPHGPADGSCLN